MITLWTYTQKYKYDHQQKLITAQNKRKNNIHTNLKETCKIQLKQNIIKTQIKEKLKWQD